MVVDQSEVKYVATLTVINGVIDAIVRHPQRKETNIALFRIANQMSDYLEEDLRRNAPRANYCLKTAFLRQRISLVQIYCEGVQYN